MEIVHPHERSVQAYSEMGSTSVSQQVVALYIVLMDGAIWFDGCTASFRLDFQLGNYSHSFPSSIGRVTTESKRTYICSYTTVLKGEELDKNQGRYE